MTVALYRRYRPARFDELVGQELIATTLRNEVRTRALAHAYLFTGTRGTGKTSAARILARAVNCEAPDGGEPDGVCAACQEVASGASVDVLEIDAASNRGIDEMRDLREKVKYLPASLRRKVYIIDEAHMLTTEAWNAFLKTLEEPPEHVFFVLATTEPHKVPETVRSRVQRFDFRRVPADAIERHLRAVAEREGAAADDAALALVARAAQGSVRDALSLLEQALSTGERPVTVETVRRELGLTDPRLLQDLVRSIAGADAAGTLRAAAAAFEAGADPRQLLRELARLARAAELSALGWPEGMDVSPEEASLCADAGAIAAPGLWVRALDLFAEAEMNLRQPVDARLQVELALLRLVRPAASEQPDAQLAALIARVDALERRSARPPSGETAGPPAVADNGEPAGETAEAAKPGPSTKDDRDPATPEGWAAEWPVLIEAVARSDAMLAGVLRDCRVVETEPGRVVVGAKGQFHYDCIRDPRKATVLSEALSTLAGRPIEAVARFVGEPQTPAVPAGTVSDATQEALRTFAGSRVTSTRLREPGERALPRPPRAG
ncbi:MAG: DNA polymerase III subunit gamma/tau [Candidatus Dormibacteraeota bacterium]|nr:DNA polymerase III subunit gamma/tau [Candidatus Dormibacteraeota bacterium]